MNSGNELVLLAIPVVIALAAAAGSAALYGQLDGARSTFAKVVLWILIVALGTIAFGIGSCMAILFTFGIGSVR